MHTYAGRLGSDQDARVGAGLKYRVGTERQFVNANVAFADLPGQVFKVISHRSV